MHGRLWCPGVYGSRYQHTPVPPTSERLVPAGTATPSHTANHQVIMRDQRYGPILIVRIECGGAGCFSLLLSGPGRGENRPLPAYTDPSMRYVAIYDTGPDLACFVREKTAPLQPPPPPPSSSSPRVDTRILSPIYLPTLFFVIFFRGSNPRTNLGGLSERTNLRSSLSIDEWITTANGFHAAGTRVVVVLFHS